MTMIVINSLEVKNKEEMPWIGASIISACDAYDAMTNDRVYRKAMTQEEAFEELRRNGNSQFDPTVVELLIDSIRQNPECVNRVTLDEIHAVNANEVESQVLRLQNAITEENVAAFPSLLHQLATVSKSSDLSEDIQESTQRLQQALSAEDAELEKVLDLTNEMLSLVRSAKSSSVLNELQDSEEVLQIVESEQS